MRYFHEQKGWDIVLERLKKYEPIMPIETLHIFPCFLCKVRHEKKKAIRAVKKLKFFLRFELSF